MFGIGLTFASTVLLALVVWRMSSIPWLSGRVPKRGFLYGGIVVWILLAGGRSLGHGVGSSWASAAELVGITLSGVLFLVFVGLFPVELVTGFGRFCPRLAPRLRGWAMLGGCVLGLVATIQGVRPPVVTRYEVRLKDLPQALDGTTLVALSDLHLGAALGPRWLEARVAQVQALKPDAIVLLGDIVEGHGENFNDYWPAFRKLAAPLGVWAVDGNHEKYGKASGTRSSLDGTAIRTLQDELVQPAPGLVLAGRSVPRNHDEVAAILPWNPPTDRPSGGLLLLSHIPEDSLGAAKAGVGLMLSGHTHGGQVWPFNHLVAMEQPMIAGRYEVKGMTLLVCRGTGTWGPRMRLWRPSEILHIKLKAN
jgi:predicted MPP superfamily phosphohydrolase